MAGPTIKGDTNIVWGTDSGTSYGMIQKMTIGKGSTEKEYKDWQGDTKTLVISDEHDTIELTAILPGDQEPIKRGEQFTVKGNTYLCTECKVEYSNEDAAQISISGRTYQNIS